MHITEAYIDGTYGSCKQVSMPSTGQLALDLMCGSWGSEKCSAKRWFDYMGESKDNSYVPFTITYITHNSTAPVNRMKPLDPKIVPCNQAVDVRKYNLNSLSLFLLTSSIFI